MTFDPRNQSPFNALPPVVVALAAVIVGIELMFQAGAAGLFGGAEAVGWRLNAVRDWAVLQPVFGWMLETGQAPPRELLRLVTYPLIHLGFGHAAFGTVFVLAFGNVLSPFYPAWRFLVIFWGASLAAALVYVAALSTAQPLVGAYAGAYGLIGAFAYVSRRGLTRVDPERAFLLIGMLLAIQPIFGLASGAGLAWIPGWIAEMAGAGAGFGLAALLFPGGTARLRDRLRQR